MKFDTPRFFARPSTVLLCGLLAGWLLWPATAGAQGRVGAEAAAGKPFGVGVMSIQLPPGQRMGDPAEGQMSLVERNGRIFYPAFESRPVGQLLRGIVGRQRVTVFFLFTGDGPLDVTLLTPQPVRQTITPRAEVDGRQLMAAWWREYSRPDSADPYPQVRTYLSATLGRRLGLPMPKPTGFDLLTAGLGGELSLLVGADKLRGSMAEEILISDAGLNEPLDVDLPVETKTEEVAVPIAKGEKQPVVEPIAMRVPEECFYVRRHVHQLFVVSAQAGRLGW